MPEHAWIDRESYPFKSHFLDLQMGKMHYLDEGSGETIVMVHGNPTWSYLYRHLIQQLSPNYRCVAADHIGFGLSDKPTNWDYLPINQAKNLTTLIETLGLKNITLVVQDWGGPIGLSYAIQHPENVKRLVILNTWMWPVDRDWYYIAFSGFTGGPVGRYLIGQHNFFAKSIMAQSYGVKSRLTPAIHQHYLQALATPAERKGCWVFPGQIIGSSAWLAELWAQRKALAGMPKLIAWGMKDIAFRQKELNTWTAAFPDAQVIRLADVGHYVQEEAVSELGPAIDKFMSNQP